MEVSTNTLQHMRGMSYRDIIKKLDELIQKAKEKDAIEKGGIK